MMSHRARLRGRKQHADRLGRYTQTTISGKYNIIEHEVS